MKVKSGFVILFIVTMLILIPMSDDSFAAKKAKLHFGQTISMGDIKLNFFDVNDSRCPSDVTCVWAGQVTVMVNIENKTHTKTVNFMPSDSYTFFSPYKITLVDVSPYPISTEKPDYIATFVMSSLDGTPPCEEHMLIKDGLCVPKSPTPLDFRGSGNSVVEIYAYSGLSLIGTVVGFFIIKKWKNKKLSIN